MMWFDFGVGLHHCLSGVGGGFLPNSIIPSSSSSSSFPVNFCMMSSRSDSLMIFDISGWCIAQHDGYCLKGAAPARDEWSKSDTIDQLFNYPFSRKHAFNHLFSPNGQHFTVCVCLDPGNSIITWWNICGVESNVMYKNFRVIISITVW